MIIYIMLTIWVFTALRRYSDIVYDYACEKAEMGEIEALFDGIAIAINNITYSLIEEIGPIAEKIANFAEVLNTIFPLKD